MNCQKVSAYKEGRRKNTSRIHWKPYWSAFGSIPTSENCKTRASLFDVATPIAMISSPTNKIRSQEYAKNMPGTTPSLQCQQLVFASNRPLVLKLLQTLPITHRLCRPQSDAPWPIFSHVMSWSSSTTTDEHYYYVMLYVFVHKLILASLIILLQEWLCGK